MKKRLILPLSSIVLLLVLLFIVCRALTGKEDPRHRTPALEPKPDNIDSLTDLIRKDKHYPVKDVTFDRNDSILVITVIGPKASVRYFDTTYHVSMLRSIDGVTILNKRNRQLDAQSNKGFRLLAAFQAKWCSANECRPLTDRIKQQLSDTSGYKPIRLWIDRLGDSSFIITDSFQAKDSSGRITTQKVLAQIDLQGRIWTYDSN